MFDIMLGDQVRDVITGYTGIVVARIEYLFGVRSCLVQAQHLIKAEGEPVSPIEIAAARLRVVQRDALQRDLDPTPQTPQ